MKPAWAIPLLVVAMLAPGAASVAAAEPQPTTAVAKLSWTDSDEDVDFFSGRLASPDNRCKRNRQLRLYRKVSGPDPLVKRGRSLNFSAGEFIIEVEDPGSGEYYVKVRPKQVGQATCQPAKSGVLFITDLEGV
jgi:hypothetical protein